MDFKSIIRKIERHKIQHSLMHRYNYYHRRLLFFPIIMLFIAGIIIMAIFNQLIIKKQVVMLDEFISQKYNTINKIILEINKNPSIINDAVNLDKINSKLNTSKITFVLILGDKIVYKSNPKFNIDPYLLLTNSGKERDLTLSKKHYVIDTYDIESNETSKAKITFLIENDIPQISKDIFSKSIVLCLLFLFFICLIFVKKITRGIFVNFIDPVEKLKQGAIAIKNGNLDHKFDYSKNCGLVCINEIDMLFKEFEEMRIGLINSQKMKEEYINKRNELISNISHDLKTPISSIIGYLEGLMDGVANTPEKENRYIEIIYKKSIYMNKLINDLILFSKLDINQLEFDFEALPFSNYLKSLCEEYQLELIEKGIDFKYTENMSPTTTVCIDKKRMRRVFDNIIGNSIKYMDKSFPKITISCEEFQNRITVKVEDNGKGVPQDKINNIFERFYRVDSSRNTSLGGSGLGLSIAKQIILAHNGNIWAESILDSGTCIYITLDKCIELKSAL